MGSTNIKKEKEEFEKLLDEDEKLELQEKLNEQEKYLKDENGFKNMYIYLYSNTQIPEEFKKEISDFQNLKNVNINGIEVIESVKKEQNNWIFYIIDKGNEEKLKAISQNLKNKDSVFICFSESLFSPEIDQILNAFSKVFLKYQPFYLFLTNENGTDINIILKKFLHFKKWIQEIFLQ